MVEDRVLKRVRINKKRDAVDENKANKKTSKKKVAAVESDEQVNERDFNSW